jgi:hypothetical protein
VKIQHVGSVPCTLIAVGERADSSDTMDAPSIAGVGVGIHPGHAQPISLALFDVRVCADLTLQHAVALRDLLTTAIERSST